MTATESACCPRQQVITPRARHRMTSYAPRDQVRSIGRQPSQVGGYVRASTGALPHQVVALLAAGNSVRPSLGTSGWPSSGHAAASHLHPVDRQPTSPGVCHVRATRQGTPVSSGHSRAFPAADQDHRPPRSARRPGDRTSRVGLQQQLQATASAKGHLKFCLARLKSWPCQRGLTRHSSAGTFDW